MPRATRSVADALAELADALRDLSDALASEPAADDEPDDADTSSMEEVDALLRLTDPEAREKPWRVMDRTCLFVTHASET